MAATRKRSNAMFKVVGDNIAVVNKAADEDIERLVISCFYALGKGALDLYAKSITQNYFTVPAYRTGYAAFLKMHEDGLDIDSGMLEQYFLAMPSAAPTELLREFLSGIDTKVRVGNLERYVGVLAKKFTTRQLQLVVFDIWSQLSNGNSFDPDSMISDIRLKLDQCAANSILQIGIPVAESISPHIEEMKAVAARNEEFSGVRTGIHTLDKLTDGWQRGDLVVIGGPSTMGKTALCLSSMWGSVKEYPNEHFFFSTQEMKLEQILNRLISIETEIDLMRVRSPAKLGEAHWKKIEIARQRILDSKLIIDDHVMTPEEVTGQWLRALNKYGGIKAFYLDYLQYSALSDTDRFGHDERLAISAAVGTLKSFAKRDGGIAPVIALSQIRREAVERLKQDKNNRPSKEDFDGSSRIEKDCDLAIFIYRPSVFFPDDYASHQAELIVDKQRNGPPGTVLLRWKENYALFEDAAPKPKIQKNLDWDDLES